MMPSISVNISTHGNQPEEKQLREQAIERLRELAKNCLAQNQNQSAVFFADKLASITHLPLDSMLLARSYYATGDFHQAIHHLKKLVSRLEKKSKNEQESNPIVTSSKMTVNTNLSEERLLLRVYLMLGQSMVHHNA